MIDFFFSFFKLTKHIEPEERGKTHLSVQACSHRDDASCFVVDGEHIWRRALWSLRQDLVPQHPISCFGIIFVYRCHCHDVCSCRNQSVVDFHWNQISFAFIHIFFLCFSQLCNSRALIVLKAVRKHSKKADPSCAVWTTNTALTCGSGGSDKSRSFVAHCLALCGTLPGLDPSGTVPFQIWWVNSGLLSFMSMTLITMSIGFSTWLPFRSTAWALSWREKTNTSGLYCAVQAWTINCANLTPDKMLTERQPCGLCAHWPQNVQQREKMGKKIFLDNEPFLLTTVFDVCEGKKEW